MTGVLRTAGIGDIQELNFQKNDFDLQFSGISDDELMSTCKTVEKNPDRFAPLMEHQEVNNRGRKR